MHNQPGLEKHMHVSEQDKVAFRTVAIASDSKISNMAETTVITRQIDLNEYKGKTYFVV